MNKKIKLIVEIVLFIVVLISVTVIYNYFINKNIEKTIQENTLKNAKNEDNAEIMEIESMEQFEQEVIGANETIFIDFYATCCGPCITMTPIIKEIAKEHNEIKFVKVDVDKNEELAIKYNVMSIPTMIIMKDGKVTKTFVGVTDKESIIREF